MGSGHILDSGRGVELKKKPEEGRGKNTLPEERGGKKRKEHIGQRNSGSRGRGK
jgi:hypothetical protein